MYFSNAVLSTMGALVTASVLSATVNAGHLYDGGLEQHYGDYNHNYHQAVAGEYEYKVEVKHPRIISSHGNHKHHYAFVEDQGIQIQKIKVGIYPHHEESYGHYY